MIDKINIVRRSFRIDGGAERSVSEYLDSFERLGISATLICEHWTNLRKERVVGIETRGDRTSKLKMFVESCQKLMGESDAVFHSHEWVPGSQVVRLGDGLHSDWVDVLKTRRGRIGSAILRMSRFHRLKLELEKRTLLHPDLRLIIVNSNYVGDAVRKRYPEVSQKLHLIRNSLSPMFSNANLINRKKSSNHVTLGFVGSGWDRKGLEVVLKALTLLPNSFSLNVIGTDKAQAKYLKICKALAIDHRVTFLGIRNDMPFQYSRMNLLVHPAHYDPAPNVATEAMALGTPILGSTQTGIVDFEHVNGVYICAPNPESVAQKILSAVENYSTKQSEGLKAFANDFSHAYLDEELGKIYAL